MAETALTHGERMRFAAAARRASRVHPGPVGELISREIDTYVTFGYRLGGRARMARLADRMLQAPVKP